MKIPFPSVCFSDVFLTLKFETLVLFTIAIELSYFCLTFEDFCLGLLFLHGPRDPKRFGRAEKRGLETRQWMYDKEFTLDPLNNLPRCVAEYAYTTVPEMTNLGTTTSF